MKDEKDSQSINDYVTVSQLSVINPAFSEGSLRSLVFKSKSNGFSSCIRRVGKKVLISQSAMAKWIEEQNKDDENINVENVPVP